MDYGLKEMNDTMTKAEVIGDWVMMELVCCEINNRTKRLLKS